MSGFAALAFDFEAMGGGVRKSSPGMTLPVFEREEKKECVRSAKLSQFSA